MEELKYKVIKTEQQYQEYCTVLEGLVDRSDVSAQDEIELLTFLIEKWDEEHEALSLADPIELLSSLMKDQSIKAKDLVKILGVSKGLVSDILHYKKGLSKEVIRTLASYFKVSQEAFNRPYKLKVSENSHLKNASVMNITKELNVA